VSFTSLGGHVTAREIYATGASDFAVQLARIRASGAQALFLANFPADVSRQIIQARAAGFTGVFLGGDSWAVDQSIQVLPQAEGSFFSSDYALESMTGPARQEAERYQRELDAPLDKNAALTLDALGMVLAGAKAAGSVDPVLLREGIASLRGYEGLTGRLSFEQGGDAVRGAHVLAIEGGQVHSRKTPKAAPWCEPGASSEKPGGPAGEHLSGVCAPGRGLHGCGQLAGRAFLRQAFARLVRQSPEGAVGPVGGGACETCSSLRLDCLQFSTGHGLDQRAAQRLLAHFATTWPPSRTCARCSCWPQLAGACSSPRSRPTWAATGPATISTPRAAWGRWCRACTLRRNPCGPSSR
jgi:hypothetical protein